MSKHWFFWFRIKDQDLTSSPGTFLHGNSLFLAGSEPHNFSHSSAFPSVPGHATSPNVHCDAALLCRHLQQADHHTNFFTCLNWYSSPEKRADFFYSSVWNVPWDCWRSSVSAPSNPSNRNTLECSLDPRCTCVGSCTVTTHCCAVALLQFFCSTRQI